MKARAARTSRLRFSSDAPGRGLLRVRVPEGTAAAGAQLDGKDVPWTTAAVGDDVYVEVETDWSPHELVVKLR